MVHFRDTELTKDAIKLTLDIFGLHAKLIDNFLSLELEATSLNEAEQNAHRIMELFLDHLSVSQGRTFDSHLLFVEAEEGKVYPPRRLHTLLSVSTFDLKKLSRDLEAASKYSTLDDERLRRSLGYYQHALLLWEHRDRLADTLTRNHKYLITSVFLNLWKAVTALVGDPSVKSDRFQKRWRLIGLPKEEKAKVDILRTLRDNYDVAHYSLDPHSLIVIEKHVGEAIAVSSGLIEHYRGYLSRTQRLGERS